MKKLFVFFIAYLLISLSSCGNQTNKSYNDTIVLAHEELTNINSEFYSKSKSMLTNSNSKEVFIKLIQNTKERLIEAKKPVEELIEIQNDHGLRKTILEMFSCVEDSMNEYNFKIDLLVDPKSKMESTIIIVKEIKKLNELDVLIKELQIQYAYYNNAKLNN